MPDEQLKTLSRSKSAMLIDGDNAQAGLLAQMLVEAGHHGQVTLRRIYGDWTTNSMNSWKDTLNFHAFQPIQQFRYTIGKNAHRQCHDHRRHGYSALLRGGWLLPGFQ